MPYPERLLEDGLRRRSDAVCRASGAPGGKGGSLSALRVAALVAAMAVLGVPGLADAAGEVAGPVEVGPSWGTGDPARSSATLQTALVNHGDLADRLIRVACPASGQVALTNGTQHQDVMAPNVAQMQEGQRQRGGQNGLDLPPAQDGKPQMVTADFALTQAKQPLTDGVHVPCTLYFAHDGERIVIFTLGARPHPVQEP